MSEVTNRGGGRVEGCESSGGPGRGEGFFARALVRGDVNPHCSGLGAREADKSPAVLVQRQLWTKNSTRLKKIHKAPKRFPHRFSKAGKPRLSA